MAARWLTPDPPLIRTGHFRSLSRSAISPVCTGLSSSIRTLTRSHPTSSRWCNSRYRVPRNNRSNSMNFYSSFRRLRSSTAAQRRSYGVLVLSLLFAPLLFAQVGDNNPSGTSGIFNGQAGGCGYDPYTGNAARVITDISVAGAVGDYPLALVRTANSRTPSTTEVFGYAGGWNHNYN